MKTSTRPLTKKMIVQLLNARRQAESTGWQLLPAEYFQHTLSGLLKRGIVETKMIMENGKTMMRVFITETGRHIINNYLRKSKKDS